MEDQKDFNIIDSEIAAFGNVKKIFDENINNINDICKEIIKQEFLEKNSNNKRIEEAKKQYEIVRDSNERIIAEKKLKKISGRKFANCIIFILFFILIGFCFFSFFANNKKIIKSFEEFRNNEQLKIDEALGKARQAYVETFSLQTLEDIKNKILSKMGIKKISQYDAKVGDFSRSFIYDKNFWNFNSISQYKLRNSYIYDIFYTCKWMKNVVTKASITVAEEDANGNTYWETYWAYHTEPTPVVEYFRSLTIPSNYKQKLYFEIIENNRSEKEVKRLLKNEGFHLENKEVYQNFDFAFSDDQKIDFLTYFDVRTQQNLINYAQYMNQENMPVFSMIKNGNWLVSKSTIQSSSLLFEQVQDWMLSVLDLTEELTVDFVTEFLSSKIIECLLPIFNFISLVYTNKYIATENLEKTENRYEQDLVVKQNDNVQNCPLDIHSYYRDMTLYSGFYKFNKHADITPICEFKNLYNDPESLIISATFDLISYTARDAIAIEYTHGYAVEVPYVAYDEFREHKAIIVVPYNIKTENAKIFANSLIANNIYVSDDRIDEEYSKIIQKNKISFNLESLKDFDEFKKNIRLIDELFSQIPEIKKIPILLDNRGMAFFINEPKLFDINLLVKKLNNFY